MNKPVYLGLPIVEISEVLMHKSWYDNVKPKHGETVKVMLHGYRRLYSVHKTEDIQIDSERDVEIRFNISNCELGRSFAKEENKKNNLISKGLFKSKKIMTVFSALRIKICI